MFILLLIVAIAAIGYGGFAWFGMKSPGHKRLAVVMFVVAGLIMSVFAFPYVFVGAYTIKCGHLPVVASDFIEPTYSAPGSPEYLKDINITTNAYFCSTSEAESQGYSNNPLNTGPVQLR